MTALAILNGREIPLRIKLRVQGNESVRPLEHGGYVTAGAVIARAQFEVAQAVVVAATVSMVDRLFSKQRPTERRLHDKAMLQNFAPLDAALVGKAKADVALRGNVPLHLTLVGWMQALVLGQFERLAAFRAAQSVATIPRATVGPYGWNESAALDAGISRDKPLGFTGALRGAVERVLAEYLAIGGQFTWRSRKGLAALRAGKRHVRFWSLMTQDDGMGVVAWFAAKAAVFAGFCRELRSTVNAGIYHINPLVIDETYICTTPLVASMKKGAA